MRSHVTRMSLTELLLALCIMAILLVLAAPAARNGMDVVNVRAARETAFALATRTRSVAQARGGAKIVFDAAARSAQVIASDGVIVETASFAQYDVEILDAPLPIVLRYDTRGLGRMASRTIRFVRGEAEAGLTFSAYGRVRRW
jgi:type II secretory pathway pseudopilin PulG